MGNTLSLAGENSKYQKPGASPAGFWAGVWHGLLIVIVFIVSLFASHIRIYETNNKGRIYDFGYLLGIGLLGPISLYIGPYRLF